MSKGNRIKGRFNRVLNYRVSTIARSMSLAQRKEGITTRHKVKPSKRAVPKMTKTMRKAMLRLKNTTKGKDPNHPLEVTEVKCNHGASKILGLISSVIHTPEQVTV